VLVSLTRVLPNPPPRLFFPLSSQKTPFFFSTRLDLPLFLRFVFGGPPLMSGTSIFFWGRPLPGEKRRLLFHSLMGIPTCIILKILFFPNSDPPLFRPLPSLWAPWISAPGAFFVAAFSSLSGVFFPWGLRPSPLSNYECPFFPSPLLRIIRVNPWVFFLFSFFLVPLVPSWSKNPGPPPPPLGMPGFFSFLHPALVIASFSEGETVPSAWVFFPPSGTGLFPPPPAHRVWKTILFLFFSPPFPWKPPLRLNNVENENLFLLFSGTIRKRGRIFPPLTFFFLFFFFFF